MSRRLEILKWSLLREKRESPLVEWKSFFPRRKDQLQEKIKLVKELVALGNTAALHGKQAAHLYIGISNEGEFIGVDRHQDDFKILIDSIAQRSQPQVPVVSFEYFTREKLSEYFPEKRIRKGVYCIEVAKPVDVPFRFYKSTKEYGAILIRKGESVYEADTEDLLRLTRALTRGPIELLSSRDVRMLKGVSHDAKRIADQLKMGETRKASRLAYKLLIQYEAPSLFLNMQFTPVLLVPMLLEGVNPFALLMTIGNHKMHLSARGYPKRRMRWGPLFRMEDQIEAWSKLGDVSELVLSEGFPPSLQDLYKSYDFHGFVRDVRILAKDALASYSRKEEDRWPFRWINRIIPIAPVKQLPPKGWEPTDPPYWVDGLVFFYRMRRRFSDKGVAVTLPILDGARRDQLLIWWAIFLDPGVFLELATWAEAFRGERTSYPWEREAYDLFEEGRIDSAEYGRRLSMRGRLDRRPVLLSGGLMTLMIFIMAATTGSWWMLLVPAAFWGLYLLVGFPFREKK